MRLDPFHQPLAYFLVGAAHFMLKEYSQALAVLRTYVSQIPQMEYGHLWLAVTKAQLGKVTEAQAEIAEVLRLSPDATISGTLRALAAFKHAEDDKHFYDAVRKAGLPE